MAISTLSKITVPLASDTSASNQGLLMTKLQYRFRVTLENFGVTNATTELTKQVMDVTRPNITFEEITLDVYNSRSYLAGKHTWEPITLNVRDDVSNNVQKQVGEQLQKQFDFFEQSSAASAGDYKFTMRIEMLDGGNGTNTPTVLEAWVCYGCYIVSTNYTELKYSEQTPAMIDISIQFDNAVQLNPTNGLGSGQTVQVFPGGTSVLGS